MSRKVRSVRRRRLTAVVSAVVGLLVATCATERLPTPTSLAQLQVSANPSAIPVIGGVSTITIVGLELDERGNVVPVDRGQIFLTTNVGVIEGVVEMRDGRAIATLQSNGRAGLAAVTATAAQGGSTTLDPPVLVGNAAGLNIVLSASPATVVDPDFSSELVATAFDNDNNPLADVPIIFVADAGSLASQGSILRTNVLGQAFERFDLRGADEATVVARSGSVESNEVTIGQP